MNENITTSFSPSSQENEIILYQPDETLALQVRVEDETVWLSQAQIVELFSSSKANISEHLKHIFNSGNYLRMQLFGNSEQFVKREIAVSPEQLNFSILMLSYP